MIPTDENQLSVLSADWILLDQVPSKDTSVRWPKILRHWAVQSWIQWLTLSSANRCI